MTGWPTPLVGAGQQLCAEHHIVAPRTVTSLANLKEATSNAYLAPPSSLLPILPTKQIPINLTVGTSSDCSEIYTGQWDQLAIGIRRDFELRILGERYADNQQVGFLADSAPTCRCCNPVLSGRHRGACVMGGFEVLRDVLRHNAEAEEQEFFDWFDRLDPDRPGYREGISIELWRALPDSPGG